MQTRLVRNTGLLVGDNLALAATGAAFTVTAARLWSPDAIGSVAAVSGVLSVVIALSNLGLPNLMLGYMESERAKRRLMRHAVAVMVLASVAGVAAVFALPDHAGLPVGAFHAPELIVAGACAVTVAANVIINVADPALVATRRTGWVVVKDQSATVARFGLLAAAVVFERGAPMALLAVAAGYVAASALIDLALLSRFLPRDPVHPGRWTPLGALRRSPLRVHHRFALGNYSATMVALLPASVLPVVVDARMGATAAGYFTISSIVFSLLVVVPSMTAQALFVELSSAPDRVLHSFRRALTLSYALTLPLAAGVIVFAPLILGFFGAEYADHAAVLLRWMALASIAFCFNYVGDTLLLGMKKVGAYFVVNAVGTVAVLAAIWLGTGRDLACLGRWWALGQLGYASISVAAIGFYGRRRRSRAHWSHLTRSGGGRR